MPNTQVDTDTTELLAYDGDLYVYGWKGTTNYRTKVSVNLTGISLVTHAASSKTTPVDADELALVDSADSFALKRLTWANLKVTLSGTGLDVDAFGFRGIPQNAQSGNYTTVAADAGKSIVHASGAGAGDTYTIDSNANVAYELGTAITFVNMDSNALSIAITSDTMNLAGSGATGTRTLAQYGIATAVKVTSTVWLISGSGIT